MDNKETFAQIGKSIKENRIAENNCYIRSKAICRALCNTTSSIWPSMDGEHVFWLTNGNVTAEENNKYPSGKLVAKNSLFGGIISKYSSGSHSERQYVRYRGFNEINVHIINRAVYNHHGIDDAKDIIVNFDGDKQTYQFRYLKELLEQKTEKQKKLDELNKVKEDIRKAKEEAERRKAEAIRLQKIEEEKRLREEEEKRKEEEARTNAEIKKLLDDIEENNKRIKTAQSFIREGVSLRSQHILDPVQEDAKRCHMYDGVPVVIEGGPGTGKTTTMIQRLKFLIDKVALTDYQTPLTDAQIDDITNPSIVNLNWLYFSPTQKLLSFLRDNMREEDLHANEHNTTTLDTFAKRILIDYKLRMPNSDGPFKLYRHNESEKHIILDASAAIKGFEQFLIKKTTEIMLKISLLKTAEYPWHNIAREIKAHCKSAENIKDISALMNLLVSMQSKEKSNIVAIEKELNELKNKIALWIKNEVEQDEKLKNQVTDLFLDWEDEGISHEDNVNEDEFDDSEDNDDEFDEIVDFSPKLFVQIKSILRNLALKKIDSKVKLTKKQKELYDIIKVYVDKQDLSKLAHLEWFKKNFAFPCRGIESIIFNQIPKVYKEFRKEEAKSDPIIYNNSLLGTIIKKDSGKQIHREELELIVGFINNLVLSIYKKSKLRFESMKRNKYVSAYIDNCKPVIGVDEATDYSMIDYYFITSFKHFEYSTITLCGDIMQGLNENGIKEWGDLKWLLPNLEVCELKTSYRQLPTLLEMSKQIYVDDRNCEAPYNSNLIKQDNEPAPLCYISDDVESKTKWISNRVVDIFKYYGEEMPSVAILVGDDVNIQEMINIMLDQNILNGIPIEDCSENRESETKKCVRIFRLSDVKGMEFEVVFFYDIDKALEGHTMKMMRRYLYVGVSRATSHLAATFTQEEGNEEIIKYFDRTKRNWRIK